MIRSESDDFDVVEFEDVKMPDGRVCPDHFRGWLLKWTNYIKGYQKRWFVLSNGLLSYYSRSQAEMAHTCRGTINLAGAFIDTEDSVSFVISNGGTQVFHLRANSEVERQRWVTALELAKAKALKMLESDEDDDSATGGTENIKPLSAKLEDLQTCNELVSKHGAALQRAIGELQELENDQALLGKVKSVNEKSTLFRITSNAMISACAEFLELAQSQEKRWQKALLHERQQRMNLEETVEALAKQHNTLERACRKNTGVNPEGMAGVGVAEDNDSDEEEEEEEEDEENAEFYDAISEHPDGLILPVSKSRESLQSQTSSEQSFNSEDSGSQYHLPMVRKESSKSNGEELLTMHHKNDPSISETIPLGTFGVSLSTSFEKSISKQFRTKIPEKPDYSINLWSILKNCIGKDLSKIPMPVNFNEPLSMLQRLTEELEYSELLDKAAACESSVEQMCYVAAFTVSSYSTTSNRTGKPFNPLLGETFECDRYQDRGWRSVAEQVSHHPPTSALHVEHKDWTFWQEFSCTSKFRGKYLQIIPLGVAHLQFTKSGNHYTWRKVTTTVQNIIVGRLWIDNSGEMDIINHSTNDVCHIKFDAYNYFGRDTPRKVTGVISDSAKMVRYVISGTWDNKIDGSKVVYGKLGGRGSQPQKNQPQTLPANLLWKRILPLPGHEKMYSFTDFALTLNEPEDGVALTDSRLRPDQRFMEDCRWDEANQEKQKLEEQQRVRRRKREAEAVEAQGKGTVYEGYRPLWFEPVFDDFTSMSMFVYKGGYWEGKEKNDWNMCPDIFLL